MVQLTHSYMTTGKTIALTIGTFVGKAMPLLFFVVLAKIVVYREKAFGFQLKKHWVYELYHIVAA